MRGDIDYRMISIRNRIAGQIKSVRSDEIVSEVLVDTAAGQLTSIITTRSAQALQLKEGDNVVVMIKATDAMIERPDT
jgi:molybdopterin-binding protein